MIKLIVALGNPGPQYELTRHNVGFILVDSASFLNAIVWKNKFKGLYGEFNHNGEKIYVLKPQTFMNLSGESVRDLSHFFKINVNEILVIHDELDLPFGEIQFKKGGGLAGHNGLKSIAKELGSLEFYRLRIGIDRPTRGSVSDWVLSNFPKDLDIDLSKILEASSEALLFSIEKGIDKAANTFNKKKILT